MFRWSIWPMSCQFSSASRIFSITLISGIRATELAPSSLTPGSRANKRQFVRGRRWTRKHRPWPMRAAIRTRYR